MITTRTYLAAAVGSLSADMQDAVKLICYLRCKEANDAGKAAHGAAWAPDIDPCVNSGECCQGCIDIAENMGEK